VPGQVARLTVNEAIASAGYWVPTTALTHGTRGLWSLYVARPAEGRSDFGEVERRDVELIHTAGDRSLVRGTLGANEHVISSGTHRVVVGQRVALTGEIVSVH